MGGSGEEEGSEVFSAIFLVDASQVGGGRTGASQLGHLRLLPTTYCRSVVSLFVGYS